MAHGIKHGILDTFFASLPKMNGNDLANEVADWIAGKANSRMLLLFQISHLDNSL